MRDKEVIFGKTEAFSGEWTGVNGVAPAPTGEVIAESFPDSYVSFGGSAVEKFTQEEAEEQDVPAIEPGLTSSVGALWPPEKASFGRIKGFYTLGIVNDYESMTRVTEAIAQAQNRFNREGITRVSLRAVVSRAFLKEAKITSPRIGDLAEAQINLDGTQPAFEGSSLVYFGLNHSSRQSIEKNRMLSNFGEALSYSAQEPSEQLSRVISQSYELSILPKEIDELVINQVSDLYERFGWSRKEVEEILSQQNNIIAVASKSGEIVSAGIAEMAKVPIGDHELRIVEITEAATKDEHARRGLYTAVSTSLLLELAKMSKEKRVLGGEIDLVYGECNGNAPGVLKTARVQGRRFAREDGPNGMLSQHVPIVGSEKMTSENDLFPAFLTRERLMKGYLNETV